MSNTDKNQKVPTIVIQINGGVVNCVNADVPVRVIILDQDTEGADDDCIMDVNGGEAVVYDYVITKPAEASNGFTSNGIEADFAAYIAEQVSKPQGVSRPKP